MQLQVKAQHETVPEAVQAYTEKRFAKLSRRLYEGTMVEVTFSYDDPQRGVHERKTLSLSDSTAQSWFMLVDAAAPRQYQYQITYYVGADGTPVEAPPVTTDRSKLVVPRYKAPT